MIDKRWDSVQSAVADISSGCTIMVSGFGDAGVPEALLDAILDTGVDRLTIVSNNAGSGDTGLAALFRAGRVSRVLCSYPRSRGSVWFEEAYARGEVELEVIPQGTLSERIRAAGAGIGGFFVPTGARTALTQGREVRILDGRDHVLELPLRADVALVRAHAADRWGNLTYHAAGRNYGPTMAMAADCTIAEVDRIVPIGGIDPETIVTPGIFVDRIVHVAPAVDDPAASAATDGCMRL